MSQLFVFLLFPHLFITLRVKNILCKFDVANELIYGCFELVPNFQVILHLVNRK